MPNTNFMFNFKWMPFLKGVRFKQLSDSQKQMVNHFEYHHEITTKDLLFKNVMYYAELNKINVFDHLPLTFIVDVDSQTYTPDFAKFVQCYEAIENITTAADKGSADYHKQCLKLINAKIQQISPSKERRAVLHCRPKLVDTHFAGKNLWILKVTGFNRGRGVTMFNSMEKLKSLIKYYSGDATTIAPKEDSVQGMLMAVKSRTFVIQKYIERPLLIHGRKFDIRVWVLVTHEMKVYFFKEGYIRTSSAEYSLHSQDIDKLNVHLTNNAVQKFYKQYGEFEDGNQLSFKDFQVVGV